MKVLYFSQGWSPHDRRFLEALGATEHEVTFMRLDRSAPVTLPAHITEADWQGSAEPVTWKNISLIAKNFSNVYHSIQPDLVHAGPIQGPALVAAYSRVHPLVTMSWGSDLLKTAESSWWMRTATRYTLKHSTVMVGDCQTVANKAVRFGIPRDRIRLFPWGVDLSHFSPESRSELRSSLGWEQNFVLLCNRSMEPLYGVDVVVKAFIRAAKQMPSLRLMLYGRGSQEPVLREWVERAGLSASVHFGGFVGVDELPGLYRSADLYLSASHSDGSSVSLMEALACGTPALVSDIPSNREWIEPGMQGWLFADGNVQQLAQMIQRAALSTELPRMRIAARALAEQRANWPMNFQVLLQAYDLALRSDLPE